MNHPSREEWMSYLYDELTGKQHANLAAHLAVCPECKAQVAEWRGVTQELNAWNVEAKPSRSRFGQPLVRWAAAAALMIGFGFAVGRGLPGPVDVDKVRAAIEPSVRQQLRTEFAQLLRDEVEKSVSATLAASTTKTKEFLGEFAKAYEQNRADDNRAIFSALTKLDSQRVADSASLKRQLDTVAVFSETGLRETQHQLVQLANYTQPAGNPTDSPQQ